MEVNILKSGKWAFGGIKVIDIKKGLQDIKKELADELIQYGWAELPKEEKPDVNVKVMTSDSETIKTACEHVAIGNEISVESVEEKSRGWWHVKFEDREEIIKVRGADNDEEAIVLAKAKLEVE